MAASTYFNTVEKLYIAFYQRPADPAGLLYWSNLIDVANGNAASVVNAFATSAEATALYGPINSTTIGTVIDAIYNALYNRNADTAGKAFYVAGFTAGTFTAGSIAVNILNGASGTDAVAINNKVAVATTFTQQVDGRPLSDVAFGTGSAFAVTYDSNDLTAARAILKTVDEKPANTLNASQVTVALQNQIANTGDTILGTVSGQTYVFTTGVDNIVGTANNDVFNSVINNQGAATTATAGALTTLNLGDQVDGGSGSNTVNVTTNLTGASSIAGVTLKNIQTLNVNNVDLAGGTVSVNGLGIAPQVTQVNATGNGNLTVTNLGTGTIGVVGVTGPVAAYTQTVTAAGVNTINLQGTSISTAAATAGSVINVDVSGGSGTSAQAVVLTSTGSTANNISNIKIGNTTVGAGSLAVTAAANVKTTVTEWVANTLKTITATGAAATVDLGTQASTALVSVDGSGLTAGGLKVGIGANVATTFVGGTGNDTVTIAAGAAMTGAVNGGAGSNTLSISDVSTGAGQADTSLVTATASKFTNFQTLQVAANGTATATWNIVFDASQLAVTNFNIATSTNGVTVNNLAAAPTVNLIGNVATTGTVFGFKTPSVTNTDTLTFNINNQSTATSGNVSGLTDVKLTVGSSVSTLNIGSAGAILGTGTENTITSLSATDTGLTKIAITGAAPLSLTTGALTKSLTIDGSAATGSLTINASGMATTTAFANINGGTANDTLVANNAFVGTETIYGGGGGDTITLGAARTTQVITLVYKAGTDSLLDSSSNASGDSGTGTANTGKMDAVTNFTTGVDKIDLTAFNTITAQKGVADKGTFATLSAAISAATASTTFFNDATNTQRVASEFHVGADTYVIVDANHDGVFNATTDLGVKLTGVAAVVAADFLA